MAVPFFVKSKLKIKNNSQDTYAATVENDGLTQDATFKNPNVTTGIFATINNGQIFSALQTFTAGLKSNFLKATGTKDTSFVSGAVTADTTLTSQDRTGYIADLQNLQDSAADKPSYYFSTGSTANIAATGTQLAVGTSDFSFLVSAKYSELSAVADEYLGCLIGTGIFLFGRRSSLPTTLSIYDGAWTNTGVSLASKEYFTIIVVRSAGVIYTYIDGVKVHQYNNASPDNIIGTPILAVGSLQTASVNHINGSVYRGIFLNYALNPATSSKIARYSAGAKLDWEDVGGSMSDKNVTNGTFDTDTNWTKSHASITINTTSKRAIFNNVPVNQELNQNYTNGFTPLTVGKRYRIELKVAAFTSGSIVFYVSNGGATTQGVTTISSPVAGTTYSSAEFVATSAHNFIEIFSGTAGSTFELDDVKVITLGCVLDLEPEGISKATINGTVTNKWLDSSPNGLHGTATEATPTNTTNEYMDDIETGVALTSEAWADGGRLLLPAGEWELSAIGNFTPAATTNVTRMIVAIGTSSGNSATGVDGARNRHEWANGTGETFIGYTLIKTTPKWKVIADGLTTYYCKALAKFTVSTFAFDGTLVARRIR